MMLEGQVYWCPSLSGFPFLWYRGVLGLKKGRGGGERGGIQNGVCSRRGAEEKEKGVKSMG